MTGHRKCPKALDPTLPGNRDCAGDKSDRCGQSTLRWAAFEKGAFTTIAFATICWSLAGFSSVTQAASQPSAVDLYLVAGQSNAVGFDANPAQLPADPADKEILLWWRCGDPPPDDHDSTSRGQWTFLQPQPRGHPAMPGEARQYGNFSHREGGFGPEMGFARELYARGRRKMAVIKVAFSGTGMWADWNFADARGEGPCYRALVTETKLAIAVAKENGIALRVRALVWVQGESDANARDAANYETALSGMLSALRRDLNSPGLFALLGFNTQLSGGENPFVEKIVDAQKAIAIRDSRCSYVDTSGATVANAYHFDAAGMLDVGRRFAKALLNLESRASVNDPVLGHP